MCGSGSTGRIVSDLYDMLVSRGHEVRVAYAHGVATRVPKEHTFKVNGKLGYLLHNVLGRLTDRAGFYSTLHTLRFIRFIKRYQPDVIHLHNLHGYWINISILFKFLAKYNRPVVWTLHDCWAFTGHCAHFLLYGCDKWRCGCHSCEHLNAYPNSWFVDQSKRNFIDKKTLFTALGDKLTIVPVSSWLEGLVKQSFLQNLPIKTIHNGIDLTVFYPKETDAVRMRYGLVGKKVILGVALPWSAYKGLPDFFALRNILDENYMIMLVGLSAEQKNAIPNGIIGLERTESVDELAELYSMADVFVNTTYCDNYPTVNLEAMACGTPVITYNTGGSPEAVTPETGRVVEQGNVNLLALNIQEVCAQVDSTLRNECRKRAEEFFEKRSCFMNYMELYDNI